MITASIKGIDLELESAPGLFSPSRVDKGTLAMLEQVAFSPGDKVLDLGCGCGVVGIVAAGLIGARQVTMCDIDPLAVETSARNARRNGVEGVRILLSDGLNDIDDTGYTLILSNPPYHTDFSVAKRFIEGAFRKLSERGTLYMVTKRRDWYRNKLAAVFGGVGITELEGYFVFAAQKRPRPVRAAGVKQAGQLSKKLRKKQEKKGGSRR